MDDDLTSPQDVHLSANLVFVDDAVPCQKLLAIEAREQGQDLVGLEYLQERNGHDEVFVHPELDVTLHLVVQHLEVRRGLLLEQFLLPKRVLEQHDAVLQHVRQLHGLHAVLETLQVTLLAVALRVQLCHRHVHLADHLCRDGHSQGRLAAAHYHHLRVRGRWVSTYKQTYCALRRYLIKIKFIEFCIKLPCLTHKLFCKPFWNEYFFHILSIFSISKIRRWC